MASIDVKNLRTYGTNGAAAYDMYALPLERPEAPALPEERVLPQKEQKQQKQKKSHAFSITPFGAIGGVAVVMLIALMIFGYVRLYTVSTDVTKLQRQADTLAERNAALSAMYESRIDLNEIERYATTQLGMNKPSSSQTVFLNLSGTTDRAEIYTTAKENPLKTVWNAIESGVEDLAAYFF